MSRKGFGSAPASSAYCAAGCGVCDDSKALYYAAGGLSVWFLDRLSLTRNFELMEQYADHPMGLADASVIAAAEVLQTRKVFTLDKADFAAYRIRRGHRHQPVDVIE